MKLLPRPSSCPRFTLFTLCSQVDPAAAAAVAAADRMDLDAAEGRAGDKHVCLGNETHDEVCACWWEDKCGDRRMCSDF